MVLIEAINNAKLLNFMKVLAVSTEAVAANLQMDKNGMKKCLK